MIRPPELLLIRTLKAINVSAIMFLLYCLIRKIYVELV